MKPESPFLEMSPSLAVQAPNQQPELVVSERVTTRRATHPPESSPECLFPTNRKYIQGMIQGDQAFIITNLLGEHSRTLFQSQMIWTIGRSREAALPLKDQTLSRHHAVLMYVRDQGFYLVDLNSMNGSYVNGARIQQRQRLMDGDRIRLGDSEFLFFVSSCCRSLAPLHPEVLARLKTSDSQMTDFIEYAALEEPPVEFKVSQ